MGRAHLARPVPQDPEKTQKARVPSPGGRLHPSRAVTQSILEKQT